jgi:hypothetical protein
VQTLSSVVVVGHVSSWLLHASAAMECSNPNSPFSLISRLGKCSRSLSIADGRELACAAVVFRETVRRSVQGALQTNLGTFALRSSGTDGTLLTCSETVSCELPSSANLRGVGRFAQSFWLGSAFTGAAMIWIAPATESYHCLPVQ